MLWTLLAVAVSFVLWVGAELLSWSLSGLTGWVAGRVASFVFGGTTGPRAQVSPAPAARPYPHRPI